MDRHNASRLARGTKLLSATATAAARTGLRPHRAEGGAAVPALPSCAELGQLRAQALQACPPGAAGSDGSHRDERTAMQPGEDTR
jgi:hypothetical protein